jgi:hypothetical protein
MLHEQHFQALKTCMSVFIRLAIDDVNVQLATNKYEDLIGPAKAVEDMIHEMDRIPDLSLQRIRPELRFAALLSS